MPDSLLIFLAGLAAGGINSIAGGGSLVSFPALLFLGRNAIAANVTNTVAIWPGSLAAAYGFRKDLGAMPRWLLLLMIPSMIGGAFGGWLLLRTPETTFNRLVPFLILGATILLALQEPIKTRLGVVAHAHESPRTAWVVFVFGFQCIVAIYGGYFGAGMGILMLAALGLIGMTDLHRMNALKNILSVGINGVAAIYFVIVEAVAWRDVAFLAGGSVAGGLLGARLAHRLGRGFVRAAVVVIGLVMTAVMFWKVRN